MDSLTQFVLGATVSTLCLGKTLGPRKAALIGGALGTLPDLDVFIPFDDPVDSFVFHRGWTHSVLVHTLAAPIIGEIFVRSIRSLRDQRPLVWLTVFLCLVTHAIIDAMTVYGTRIFWPLFPDPVGVGSVFIIDPIYTLPLLGVTLWALLSGRWSSRLNTGVVAAFAFSSLYMGLSAVTQRHIEARAQEIFARQGIAPDRIFAIASPFNTVLWRVIGLEEDRYHNLYLSLLDGADARQIYTHPRHPEIAACVAGTDAFQKLEWFSRGYYRADRVGEEIIISDLRMGLTPAYAFQFAIAERQGATMQPMTPESAAAGARSQDGDFAWLGERFMGRPAQRDSELVDMPDENLKSFSC